MHIRIEPSGLGTNNTGAPQGELEGTILPASNSSFTCLSASPCSTLESRNGGLFGGMTSSGTGTHSGVNSRTLLSVGASKTSANSCSMSPTRYDLSDATSGLGSVTTPTNGVQPAGVRRSILAACTADIIVTRRWPCILSTRDARHSSGVSVTPSERRAKVSLRTRRDRLARLSLAQALLTLRVQFTNDLHVLPEHVCRACAARLVLPDGMSVRVVLRALVAQPELTRQQRHRLVVFAVRRSSRLLHSRSVNPVRVERPLLPLTTVDSLQRRLG